MTQDKRDILFCAMLAQITQVQGMVAVPWCYGRVTMPRSAAALKSV